MLDGGTEQVHRESSFWDGIPGPCLFVYLAGSSSAVHFGYLHTIPSYSLAPTHFVARWKIVSSDCAGQCSKACTYTCSGPVVQKWMLDFWLQYNVWGVFIVEKWINWPNCKIWLPTRLLPWKHLQECKNLLLLVFLLCGLYLYLPDRQFPPLHLLVQHSALLLCSSIAFL